MMSDKPRNHTTELRGVGRLGVDAISGITDLVESLHQTIASFTAPIGTKEQKRTSGITGVVFQSIRSITAFAGSGIDTVLDRFSSLLGEKMPSAGRNAAISALNGVLGDHLQATNNPLTISMQFRREGLLVDLQTLADKVRKSRRKLLIMVHGACMNDLQWNRDGHDHGAALENELDYEPVYLHYNTGLHISENGRRFSQMLETLVNQEDENIDLVIIAHSMGGLVSRSACFYATDSNHAWLSRLSKMVFLGTPHHGAPLAKGSNWLDMLLEISPYSAPFSRLSKIRSSGLTDLRHGNVIDEDWQDRDRFEVAPDRRISVPLPEHVQCYAIAATTSKDAHLVGDDLIGDGLVTVNSALGRHKDHHHLMFPQQQQWIGRDMHHMDLLNHSEVYATIRNWLVT